MNPDINQLSPSSPVQLFLPEALYDLPRPLEVRGDGGHLRPQTDQLGGGGHVGLGGGGGPALLLLLAPKAVVAGPGVGALALGATGANIACRISV